MSKADYQDDAFWFSKISDYQRCPRYYQLKHLEKVQVDEPRSADLEFGTAMHLGINEYLLGRDGLDLFNFHWDIQKSQDLAYSRLDHETLKECAEKLLTRFERLHLKKFKLFRAEERVHVTVKGVKLEGTPDFVGEFEGVPSVVDFKTAAYRYDKRKIVCDAQMPTYAAMSELGWKYKPEQMVYLVFIKDKNAPSIQTVKRPLTTVATEASLNNVITTCEEAASRKVFPMNTRSCIIGTQVCPYFEKCFGGGVNEQDD